MWVLEKAACAKENQANQGGTFEFLQKRNVFFRATQQNQGIVSETKHDKYRANFWKRWSAYPVTSIWFIFFCFFFFAETQTIKMDFDTQNQKTFHRNITIWLI